jgi:diphosphomevalonate decarboxylase
VKKSEVVSAILGDRFKKMPQHSVGQAFAPSNIALCKYWGKRNQELNLPITSSLSISLADKGATTEIKIREGAEDLIILNNQVIDNFSSFGKRLIEFLNLFRKHNELHFTITIVSNIPVAAGMASSACGFAALILALNELYGWNLSLKELSIFARLGSGSACRSIWKGFVEWHVGLRDDGMDSHGESIFNEWPDFCIGLLILSDKEKSISSREAMQRTITTSHLYSAWPSKVSLDLSALKQAISIHDFELLGKTAESNAINMHATMLAAWPPISYYLPETMAAMHKIWNLRKEGLQLYFTQDAGSNLKLLLLKQDIETVKGFFPDIDILYPFLGAGVPSL